MRQQANTDLKVGLMVLVGLAILIFGIGWAKSWRYGAEQIALNTTFESASGIEVGDPVFIRGLKRGQVDKISESGGRIAVRIELFEPITLHKDASASIAMLELMGGKKIDISPGTTGSFDLSRDTLLGNANGDLSSIVSFVNSLTGTVEQLAHRVDSVLASVNDIFGNGALKSKSYALLDEATRTIATVHRTLDENRTAIAKTLGDIDELAKTGSTAIAEIRPGVTMTLDSLRQFISRSESSINSADSLLRSIGSIVSEARTNKSLLYKLTIDKQFSRQIDSTVRAVNLLLEQIRTEGADVNIHLFR
ncbi:MAG: MCE family protein [Bacteroidetes bacterium]|nr:MCE family protein [Bacteroidota bacterium]